MFQIEFSKRGSLAKFLNLSWLKSCKLSTMLINKLVKNELLSENIDSSCSSLDETLTGK